MAEINSKHINIVKKLIREGLTTKKDILNLNLHRVLSLNLTKNEIRSACNLIDAIKTNDLMGFFVSYLDERTDDED